MAGEWCKLELACLRGTRVAHTVVSLGSLGAMLTFVLEQPPLVMFCALIAPSLEVAFRIARVFGVPLEEIFAYEPADDLG